MSVVVPRPPSRREVEAYGDDVQRRLLAKPGITVCGRSVADPIFHGLKLFARTRLADAFVHEGEAFPTSVI